MSFKNVLNIEYECYDIEKWGRVWGGVGNDF